MNSGGLIARFAGAWFCACFLVLVAEIATFAQAGRGTISGAVTDPALSRTKLRQLWQRQWCARLGLSCGRL